MNGLRATAQGTWVENSTLRMIKADLDSCKEDRIQLGEYGKRLRYNDSLISRQRVIITNLQNNIQSLADHKEELAVQVFEQGESLKRRNRGIRWLIAAGAILGTGLIIK